MKSPLIFILPQDGGGEGERAFLEQLKTFRS
jgi:hypothetical protein